MHNGEANRFEELLCLLQDEHRASLSRLRRQLLNIEPSKAAKSGEEIQFVSSREHSTSKLALKDVLRDSAREDDDELNHIATEHIENFDDTKPSMFSKVSVPGTAWDGSWELERIQTVETLKPVHSTAALAPRENLSDSYGTSALNDTLDSKRKLEKVRKTKIVSNIPKTPSEWIATKMQQDRRSREYGGVLYYFFKLQGRFEAFMDAWEDLEEPDMETSRVGRLVTSIAFNMICFCVILFDTVFTALTLNHAIKTRQENLTTSMQIISMCILGFYTLELALKVTAFGKFYFIGKDLKWNWLDFVLVAQALLNVFMDLAFAEQGENVTFIRFLRLMKLVKIFRLVRALKFLRELRIMVVSIASSLSALFWAFVTLALVLYVFSLIFVQAMSAYISDNWEEIDFELRDRILLHFGSVQATTLTLYQSSSNGVDWINVYDMVQLSGWVYSTAFIFFIGFFNFAVLNILTAIFMEKALTAAAPDRDVMALEQRRKDERYADELLGLLLEMDEDNSGTISLEEFITKSGNRFIQAYFMTLGLNIQDAQMFFGLISRLSGQAEVPIEEFVWRCVRMKGAATSLDLQGVAYEVSRIHEKLRNVCRAIGLNAPI